MNDWHSAMNGWSCPQCSRVWAPQTAGCLYCNDAVSTVSTATPSLTPPGPGVFGFGDYPSQLSPDQRGGVAVSIGSPMSGPMFATRPPTRVAWEGDPDLPLIIFAAEDPFALPWLITETQQIPETQVALACAYPDEHAGPPAPRIVPSLDRNALREGYFLAISDHYAWCAATVRGFSGSGRAHSPKETQGETP